MNWLPVVLLQKSIDLRNISRALLVIAHPDDESMFFSPLLLYLIQNDITVHVISLSSGYFPQV